MNIGEEISDEGEVVSDISEIKEGEIIAGDQQNVMENEYNLEFFEVKSGRGRSLLSRLGYEYYFENESRTIEGVEYWRCAKRSNGKITNAAHNHPADPEKQSIRDAIEKLKNLARTENPLTTREAVDQSRATINMAFIILDENLLINNANKRIFVFASPFSLELLTQYPDDIAIDGTFDTAPRGFMQIFTIHVMVDHCVIPAIFALLPSKATENYVRVFQSILLHLPNFMPARVMSDFELSELNAVDQVFPQSQKTGCNFHMGNAIFRKIQNLPQLNQLYHENEESRHRLRSFQALAFVPNNEVYTFFCILVEDFNHVEQPQILDLLRYFVLTWIGPNYVMQHPPIDPGQEDLNYGVNVDAWIRAWIVNENLQNRIPSPADGIRY
uniref:MULE transposase domain-containing protein n=1 Tax=Meloidogyne javanica TaxID=6303 RepID=A0A915MB22_MELJA